MGEIYQNAYCTLAATTAKDSEGGLFFDRRNSHRNLPCAVPVIPKGEESKTFYCADQEQWTRNVSNGPLNSRAWVLQERLLSPRVLHFSADQLFWECSELDASEAFPEGLPDGLGERFKRLLPFSGLLSVEQPGTTRHSSYALWDRIMHIYSSGKLSRTTDRLVAISGIAHKLSRSLFPRDTYLAGLWKRDLPFQLLWDVKEPQISNQPLDYIAPTWSWASRDGTVPCEDEVWTSAASLIEVTTATVRPVDMDHMGQLLGGYIRLVGLLLRGSLLRAYQPGSSTPGIALTANGQMVNAALCSLDSGYTSTVQLPRVIYCLPVLIGKRNGIPRYRGLLLMPTGREKEFRRYGTFTADAPNGEFSIACSPLSFETGDLGPDGRYEFTII